MTGGTIGSITQNNIINVRGNSYHIIELYKEKCGSKDVDFEPVQAFNILSENFTYRELTALANLILSRDVSMYDGIIVTHGSDTLCYTSAFIAMLTRHFKIPIVMVASNYELSNPKANGLNNFIGAVDLIKSKMLRGCFVVWQDSITNSINIHLGSRLRECDSFTDNFQSFGGVPFAEIVDSKIVLNTNKVNPTIAQINQERKPICSSISMDKTSMMIKSYVGLDYSKFNLMDVDSILIYLYHSGTACIVGTGESLLEFIEKHSNKKIYIASLKHNDDMYITQSEILKHPSVIPMYNISIESAYIKTLILSNVENLSSENLFFEEIEF